MRIVVGEMTPEERERHERKLLNALLWMKNHGKARCDGEEHPVAITRQLSAVKAARSAARLHKEPRNES